MKQLWKLFAIGLIALALAGCASLQRPIRTSPQNGAIFGYFDIPRPFGYLQHLSILGANTGFNLYVGIPNDVRYIVRGGAFFAYDAKPGQYQIAAFYTVDGGYFNREQHEFNLVKGMLGSRAYNDRLMQDSFFTVKPGELHYVGVKKIYIGKQQGLTTDGTFSVGEAQTPTEKEVLEKLIPALKGSSWQQPAEALLASLR